MFGGFFTRGKKKSLDVILKFIFASVGHVAIQIIMHWEANLKWTTFFILFFCLNNLYLNLYDFWGKIFIFLMTSLKTSVGRRKQIRKKKIIPAVFFKLFTFNFWLNSTLFPCTNIWNKWRRIITWPFVIKLGKAGKLPCFTTTLCWLCCSQGVLLYKTNFNVLCQIWVWWQCLRKYWLNYYVPLCSEAFLVEEFLVQRNYIITPPQAEKKWTYS